MLGWGAFSFGFHKYSTTEINHTLWNFKLHTKLIPKIWKLWNQKIKKLTKANTNQNVTSIKQYLYLKNSRGPPSIRPISLFFFKKTFRLIKDIEEFSKVSTDWCDLFWRKRRTLIWKIQRFVKITIIRTLTVIIFLQFPQQWLGWAWLGKNWIFFLNRVLVCLLSGVMNKQRRRDVLVFIIDYRML